MQQAEEESNAAVPQLPDPAIKAICAALPLPARCQARLVCRAWRGLAGEAVNSIGFSAAQLRKQVFRDFTAKQALQQLRKAAAAEVAAAGGSAAAAAAAAAAVDLTVYLRAAAGAAAAAADDVQWCSWRLEIMERWRRQLLR
ncbi:hypothetical protein OEZ85_013694 [Tetradesmus obliquus]|uniref:F-box domain-containing protein n=1 Tax=Tetradesmus obliquus TaxID=3088 RepID=A0ABY8US73_TETOB|nr:hypothetical protein OEZ85_013694 [Tetradesmus obliquus]